MKNQAGYERLQLHTVQVSGAEHVTVNNSEKLCSDLVQLCNTGYYKVVSGTARGALRHLQVPGMKGNRTRKTE